MSDIIEIICQRCLARNRVPETRLMHQPKCGRCHHSLFFGEPVELDETTFDLFLKRNQTPLLVDFWAPWCGPCVQMAPSFAAAAEQLEPRARLAKVNSDACDELSTRFGIRSIPTLLLFNRGREIARQAGALTTSRIVSWATRAMPSLR